MSYYCYICLRDIKKRSKYSHLKYKYHKAFEKYIHIILSLKNIDIKNVDEILYLYKIDHNKKFNHYLIKGEFKLVFNNNQDCKYIITAMIDDKSFVSWSNYLKDAIDNLKEEGFHFNYIAEMDIITLAHKRDMAHDFYLKQNMSVFEWKLNAMINKDKNLINKFPQNWRQPLNRKFESHRVSILILIHIFK